MTNCSTTEISKHNPPTGKICVSIGSPDVNSALAAARRVDGQADVIEIRLDTQDTPPQIKPFLTNIETPLLFTNRPDWEGGYYKGRESERLKQLAEAIRAGTAYIDIELRTGNKARRRLIDLAYDNGCQSIVSWHNFANTPPRPELEKILSQMYDTGATIGKIVTMAHDFIDVLRVLRLQVNALEKNFSLCAFCMGKAGKISRLATLSLGGYMTYAAPDSAANTAPGQFELASIKKIMELVNEN